MENNENIPQQNPQKESPFANSPYVMNHPQEPVQQAPVPEAPAYTPAAAPTAAQPPLTPPVYRPPVYNAPVQQPPIYTPPAYQAPVYTPPAYQAPVYTPPVAPTPAPAPAPAAAPQPEQKAEPQPAKKPWLLKAIIAAAVALTLIVASCGITAYLVSQDMEELTLENERELLRLREQLRELEDELENNSFTGNGNSVSGTPVPVEGLTPGQVYARNKNSVVGIANKSVSTNIFGQTTETASSGSGFIISADGYIVTNYHVIEGASTLTVITDDEDEYEARVIGYDADNDFAVIKVDVNGLTPVTLGSSSDLIVGDMVAAIGNPLGEMTNSLTVGYISVKDRDVAFEDTIINMLQTDCAINPGNSGGPLFNMKGEVIGITTAKYSGTAVESIGFAIPIDDVLDMINQLITKGYISTPYMGVRISTQADGVGALISEVEAGSPAAAAGILKGDIIMAIGDYQTSSLAELDRVMRRFEPGDTVTIRVKRGQSYVNLTITFGAKVQQA